MYIKCPKCGLNYMTDYEKMCSVCVDAYNQPFINDELCEICGNALDFNEYKICGECLSNKL